jgi:hypothetical protein
MNGPTTSFTEMGLHRQVNPYPVFPIAWPVVDRNLSNRTRHINIITIKKYSVSLAVILNGKEVSRLWAVRYRVALKDFIKKGLNTLEVQVTRIWYNRLVFDAGQPEQRRKTWTIDGPDKNSALSASGLIGPVQLNVKYLVNSLSKNERNSVEALKKCKLLFEIPRSPKIILKSRCVT